MSYSSNRKPRKPIYDPESGVPPTDAQIRRMKKQADNVAKYWIDQRALTESEMREKLGKKKLPTDIVDGKVEQLKKQGLLNDELFVEDFVLFKQEYMSERKMRDTLLRKGLDEELVAEALLEIDEEEQESGALRVASRRARGTVKEQNPHKRRNKILTSVVGRGYGFGLADKVTAQAIEENPAIVLVEEDETLEEEETRLESQAEEAYKLAESKVRATRSKTDRNKRLQSIIQSLIRKGYTFDVARETAERALADSEESD